MMKSKKAAIEPFPLLVGVMGAVILLTIVSILLADYAYLKRVNPEPLGGKAVEVLDAYQEADEALLFLDGAVRPSMEKGIHHTGEHGFKKVVPPNFRYGYWTRGVGGWDEEKWQCMPVGLRNYFPTRSSLESAFDSYFKTELNRHVNSFNGLGGIKLISPYRYLLELSRIGPLRQNILGKECEGFSCGLGEGFECKGAGNSQQTCIRSIPPERLKLVGTAREPLVVEAEKFDYNATPSFTQTINVDLLGDFERVTGNAAKIFGVDLEELMGYTRSDMENLLGIGQQGHLLWSIDGWYHNHGGHCYSEPCTYRRCTKTCTRTTTTTDADGKTVKETEAYCCSCKTFPGSIVYGWDTTTAQISANITTQEVYFWDYKPSQLEKEKYSYKFALNWMSGNHVHPCPSSNC